MRLCSTFSLFGCLRLKKLLRPAAAVLAACLLATVSVSTLSLIHI